MARIAVIVVTHNSEPYLDRCLRAVRAQAGEPHLTVVDSGSASTTYLEVIEAWGQIRLIRTGNIGFARANNLGYIGCPEEAEFIVFLNPDAFVGEGLFARAMEIMAARPLVGCLTGRLLGYDIALDRPTGLIDSAGVFRRWYGRWYDRGQGELDQGQYDAEEGVPAGCGALLFCRRAALEQVILAGCSVFDPGFFLYKEDIELSLRLRAGGWAILYHPELTAHHCRGWNPDRRAMAREQRLAAAASEVLLYRRHPSIHMLWALAKYLLVRWLNC